MAQDLVITTAPSARCDTSAGIGARQRGQRLVVDPRWRVLYTDEKAVLACRRGLPVGGTIGTC